MKNKLTAFWSLFFSEHLKDTIDKECLHVEWGIAATHISYSSYLSAVQGCQALTSWLHFRIQMSHSLPALSSPFRYHSSIQEPDPKLIEMLPLTSRGFGWGRMSLGHQVPHRIEWFPRLSLVSRQSRDLSSSFVPSARCLDDFFNELATSSLSHTTQSENT